MTAIPGHQSLTMQHLKTPGRHPDPPRCLDRKALVARPRWLLLPPPDHLEHVRIRHSCRTRCEPVAGMTRLLAEELLDMIKPDRILLCDPREHPLVTPGQEAGSRISALPARLLFGLCSLQLVTHQMLLLLFALLYTDHHFCTFT